jgi:molybdate transport system ATP-binding protein
MLEVAVSARYGSFRLEAEFAAPAQGAIALFGRSGAGKSTIVDAIAGLRRTERSLVRVGGVTLSDTERGVFLSPERRRIGYVFQDSRLFPHLDVRANLLFGFRRTPESERRIGFEPIVELLGLAGLLDRRPAKLSGGERQRVALGRALLASPRLLLLDEPLASLDQARKAEVLPYIERLRDEYRVPIVYVSHGFEEVVRIATHLILLEEGRVAGAGSVGDLMEHPALARILGASPAGFLLEATVADWDGAHGIVRLAWEGGEIRFQGESVAAGTRLRLWIRDQDVIIATARPEGLSVQNEIPSVVRSLESQPAGDVVVRLAAGRAMLAARVTRAAVERLDLAPGRAVYALIKSVAIDRSRVSAAPL